MINAKRLTDEFCSLVSINSTSFNEREMADCLKRRLNELGFDVQEDNAGEFYNGNAGNLYCYIKGDIEGDAVLFSAHMDTVAPGEGKQAVVHDDGRITSSGATVLGADDMAGVAAIIEALRTIKENNLSHRDIELLFTIAEEAYIKGSSVFDFKRLKAKTGYVLDMGGKTGAAAIQAPTLISFEAEVTGRAAHAGFAPEKGINAIATVSEAISGIEQGRIDDESTLNIGTVSGGTSTNIISDKCTVRGEVRSYSHDKALKIIYGVKNKFETACKKFGAALSFESSVDLTAYKVERDSTVVNKFDEVCRLLGIDTSYRSTFGGSDNNNLVKNGVEGIVVACGYYNAHTTEEYIDIAELEKTAAIVLNLMTN